MSINQDWLATSVAGQNIHHRYVYHIEQASDRLLVMLPGSGYTCDMPVMYYLRNVAMQQGWDTLSVTYASQAYPDYKSENLIAEVQLALDQSPLGGGKYKRLCVAGKSLGAPLAVEIALQQMTIDTSLILLTPIMDTSARVGQVPTLAIIGTADHYYYPGIAETTRDMPNVTWNVFEGLDHRLEAPQDWHKSLEMLLQIATTCAKFLERQNNH